jgi:hypothetical protein
MRRERRSLESLDQPGGRWKREDGWPGNERQSEMRAAAPAVIGLVTVVVRLGRWRRIRRRLVFRRPSAFSGRQPAAWAFVLVHDAGAVRRQVGTCESFAAVGVVVPVRNEMCERRQLNREYEQREHEQPGGGSELGERHAAARHGMLNDNSARAEPGRSC